MNIMKRTFSTLRKTVDPKQMENFSELSKIWWEVDGNIKVLHSLNTKRLSWIRESLSNVSNPKTPLQGLSILDVGCGGGLLTEPLSLLGAKAVGIDCNAEMVRVAKEHAKIQNLANLVYEECTIEEHLPENPEKYDALVASEVIEHVREQDFFLKCCIGCLKPGGSIFLTTNSKSWFSKFFSITLKEDLLRRIPKGSHDYHMYIGSNDLKMMLKKENCKIVQSFGLLSNVFNNKWYRIKNENFQYYAIHAVKGSL